MEHRPVSPAGVRADLAALFDEPLPRRGATPERVVDRVAQEVFANEVMNISGRFMSYIMSGGTHVGIAADLLTSALNTNLALGHLAPAGSEIELRTLRWLAEFIGCSSLAGGTFVSGGSAANLHGLAAAVVAKAPFDIRIHVDGAYGAPAAGTTLVGGLFHGLGRADSIALDPHKWLFAPFDAGCILMRDPERLKDMFSVLPDYLQGPQGRHDPMAYGFELSRRARALKVWMTLLAYGADALRDAIEHTIVTMRHMAERIQRTDDLELAAPAILSVVCFRYRPDLPDHLVDEVNAALPTAIQRDGRVFIAGTAVAGRPVLRVCSVNHRLDPSHVELAVAVVRELGARLAAGIDSRPSTRE